MSVEVRGAATRSRTRTGWSDTAHSLSFGTYYDPDNVAFGLLVAHNDELLAAGGQYAEHPHRDLEIVTWVLEGELVHRDDTGAEGRSSPGVVARLSAGGGVRHVETNGRADRPVRFVQMWLTPSAVGGPPSWEQRDVRGQLAGGDLVAVVSGRGHAGALPLRQPGAVLWAARTTRSVLLPEAPYVHVLVTRGAAVLDGDRRLGEGDAVRLTGGDRPSLLPDGEVELLVWEMDGPADRQPETSLDPARVSLAAGT